MLEWGRPRSPGNKPRSKIALHLKALVSYLCVVGAVFVPTYFYLRTSFHERLREARLHELEKETEVLAARIGAVNPERFEDVVHTMLVVLPTRVTIVDTQGRVIGDSHAKADDLENHANRPEIVEAMKTGVGSSERMSATTKEVRVYSARRFPPTGPARGVVRLSMATREIDETIDEGFAFFGRAAALALSVAVMFTLLAAFRVSRPLQRLAIALRAFAEGDFGHAIDVRSNDELGDVAAALRELASKLRGSLLAAGADRATLQALLDDLPCGVIIYDARREPRLLSGAARALLNLSGADDFDRARRIAELPPQAEAIERALSDRQAQTLDLEVPWQPKTILEGRWICLMGADGEPQAALVVRDKQPEERTERMRAALKRSSALLKKAARTAPEKQIAVELEGAAYDAESTLADCFGAEECSIDSIELGALCADAVSDLGARLATTGLRIELDLSEPHIRILEVDGRGHTAVRRLLQGALGAANGSPIVRVRGEIGDSRVRLSIRTEGKKIRVGGLAELVHCIGGDAGFDRDGDGNEAWLTLPRA